jgi:hypothetical protein
MRDGKKEKDMTRDRKLCKRNKRESMGVCGRDE